MELTGDDPYWTVPSILSRFIIEKYKEAISKNNFESIIEIKNEIESYIANGGIKEICKILFDFENTGRNIPKYNDFIAAFQEHTKLDISAFETEIIDDIIRFHTNENIFELRTTEGLTFFLKSIIEERSYDEIYTMTNEHIWSEIYVDAGIEKVEFIPVMLFELRTYWDATYTRIKEKTLKTDHLDKLKVESFQEFDYFIKLYNDSGNAIELAYKISDMILYPIAVITMMQIFNADLCYSEYCALEFWELFGNGEWEYISLNEDDDGACFFIRPCNDN